MKCLKNTGKFTFPTEMNSNELHETIVLIFNSYNQEKYQRLVWWSTFVIQLLRRQR
jgi:hypothetical protein